MLSQLNDEQRQAVLATDGPLLILAGAGSGKTRVIAYRIAYLIVEKGVPPYNILAVTFTNKAAQEMRERVQRLLRGQELSSAPWVSTFHSLCVRILRQDIEQLKEGYSRTFTIYDKDDSLRLIKNEIKDLGYDDKHLGARSVQSAISSAKNQGEDVEAYAARADYVDERRAAIARIYKTYEERLHANNALDFDDLMIKTVRLLRDAPEVRDKYNRKFHYILVDEYQAFDAEAEARFVAGKIREHRNEQPNIRAAVLYRTNSQSRVFEEAMRRSGLPYNIVGGFSFYERMEVRDIIAYLKLALNPDDSIALQRVINSPPRGIGRQTLEEIERRAKDYGLSLWETISQLIEKPEGLSTRAISALKNFQRIIETLAVKAGI